jgi:hypothetical protein
VVRRFDLGRTRVVALVLLMLITLLMVAVAVSLQLASGELMASYDEAHGETPQQVRTPYGGWLAAQLTRDLAPGDLVASRTRADVLALRSDRTRELSAVPAVIGLLVALLTDAPSTGPLEPRPTSQAVANTTRNGSV